MRIPAGHFAKFLSIILDDDLSWMDHISALTCKLSKKLIIFRNFGDFLNLETLN